MLEELLYKINVSDSIGTVSAILTPAPGAFCTLVLAHGAGAGMTHSFMSSLTKELYAYGINVLRFNFPFLEANKKRPDFAPVAEKTVEAAIQFTKGLLPADPLFVSGKSFGGRMSSQYLSKHSADVKGLIFFGFPLHAANEPGVKRADHLKDVKVPMLFLQGTKDALARLELIQGVCDGLSGAELQTFDGADHAFMRGKKSFVSQLGEAAAGWLKRQLEKN